MKLLNYIEENNQNPEENEMDGSRPNYDELLTKNTKTNENLTSEDLALHGITKENNIYEKNTENFEDENSKVEHISKISEVSNSKEVSNKKAVVQNNKKSGFGSNNNGNKNEKVNSDRNNKSNSQSNVQSNDSRNKIEKNNNKNNQNNNKITPKTGNFANVNANANANKNKNQDSRPVTGKKQNEDNLKKNYSKGELHKNQSNKSMGSNKGKSEFSMSSIHSLDQVNIINNINIINSNNLTLLNLLSPNMKKTIK